MPLGGRLRLGRLGNWSGQLEMSDITNSWHSFFTLAWQTCDYYLSFRRGLIVLDGHNVGRIAVSYQRMTSLGISQPRGEIE